MVCFITKAASTTPIWLPSRVVHSPAGSPATGKPTPIAYQTPTTREDLLKEDGEIESYPLPINKDRVRVVRAQDLFER